MNAPRLLVAIVGFAAAAAFGQGIPNLPAQRAMTVQQEVELYNSIKELDKPYLKMIDGHPQAVPFELSASTRYKLAIDAGVLKPRVEAYQTAAVATQARIDPKGEGHPDSQAQLNKELEPVYTAPDPHAPILETITREDLNLDRNPIGIDVLSKLRVIIRE